MHHVAIFATGRQLHLAVFLVAHRVVVVHNRDSTLLRRTDQQLADMLTLFRIVEVGMLHQQLAHAVFWGDELPIVLHEDGLALRGVVGFILLRVAGQLLARATDIIQPADLCCAARHPDHAGLQFPAQPGENVIVNVLILLADQGHGADLADQLEGIVRHALYASTPWFRSFIHFPPR